MKTLWHHCHAATMANGTYSIIEDAAIVTDGAQIVWIGPLQEFPDQGDIKRNFLPVVAQRTQLTYLTVSRGQFIYVS